MVGILLFFLISDFPEEAKWLSTEEKEFVKGRLQDDVGQSQRYNPLKAKDVSKILSECAFTYHCKIFTSLIVVYTGKIILGGFMYFGLVVPAYGYGKILSRTSTERY